MFYGWNNEDFFNKDSIIFVNILNFIFLNNKLKKDNSGMKVLSQSLVLIFI